MVGPTAIDTVASIPELLTHILGFCALRDVRAIRQVCKQWRYIRFRFHNPKPPIMGWFGLVRRVTACAARGDLDELEDIDAFYGLGRAFALVGAENLLVTACKAGHVHVAQWIVSYAPADMRGLGLGLGRRLLGAAIDYHRDSMAGWVIGHFGPCITPASTELLKACHEGRLPLVKYLTESMEVSAEWPLERNALREACGTSQLAVARHLVERFTIAPEVAYGPLHDACVRGCWRVANWLVDNCELPIDVKERLWDLSVYCYHSKRRLRAWLTRRFGPQG